MEKMKMTSDGYDKAIERLEAVMNHNPSFYPSEDNIIAICETEEPWRVGLYLTWLLLTGNDETDEEKAGRRRVNDFLKEHLTIEE